MSAMMSEHDKSMRYFTTSHHLADDNFVFQQDNALVHHACNTVKLLERELSSSNSLFQLWTSPQQLTLI